MPFPCLLPFSLVNFSFINHLFPWLGIGFPSVFVPGKTVRERQHSNAPLKTSESWFALRLLACEGARVCSPHSRARSNPHCRIATAPWRTPRSPPTTPTPPRLLPRPGSFSSAGAPRGRPSAASRPTTAPPRCPPRTACACCRACRSSSSPVALVRLSLLFSRVCYLCVF